MSKRILHILCLIVVCLTACKESDPLSDNTGKKSAFNDRQANISYVFDTNAVPEITLRLTEKDWQQYLTNYDQYPSNRLYVPAAFSFKKDGKVFKRDSIGLRPRGNTSRIRPQEGNYYDNTAGAWHRTHFGIRFNKYPNGSKFFGIDRLILKRNNGDPAYCREMFCYDLMHRFGVWTAPYSSYCRLTIEVGGQSVYMGVYTMVENPHKGWLDQRQREGKLKDINGNLWKGAWGEVNGQWDGADLSNSDAARMGINDDYGKENYIYSLKTNQNMITSARQELQNFIKEMTPLPSGSTELKTWLEKHVDIDLLLRATAVTVAVGMWDDYWCNKNNYYFYFDTQKRFYFIPFDYDNTFGTGYDSFGNPGTKSPLTWGPTDGSRILMRKIMSIDEYKETYISYLKQLTTDRRYMEPESAKQRVRDMQSLIAEYVANDTGEDMTIEDKPAGWSEFPMYRLLNGGIGNGKNSESNFFETKKEIIKHL